MTETTSLTMIANIVAKDLKPQTAACKLLLFTRNGEKTETRSGLAVTNCYYKERKKPIVCILLLCSDRIDKEHYHVTDCGYSTGMCKLLR